MSLVKIRSNWSRVDPQPCMISPVIKRGHLDLMGTGRAPCKHEGRNQGDVSESQGMPEMDSKPPEAGREARNCLSPRDLETNTADTLIKSQRSKTMHFCCLSHLFWGLH